MIKEKQNSSKIFLKIVSKLREYLSTLSPIITIVCFMKSIFKSPKTLMSSSTIPLNPPKFKKLIFLLVDGLRFDAFVPVNKDGLYYNNFTFTKEPERLKTTFLSVSGIPTVTTCRIIGMMSGAPSNQIEELLTFFTSSVRIDSLPDKFIDRKMFFYGDNLWEQSFKALKGKTCTVHGLSKKDIELNEIDLIEKIKNDKKSEIQFIHIISLDALGHSYGTQHVKIKNALLRADNLINHLYDNMDEDTLLVVTSDHGVTNEGAHGGNSKFELASTCGFYSKKGLDLQETDNFVYNQEFISKFYDLSDVNKSTDFISAKTPYKVIHQDDILPTISYLMGVPTPENTYGNLIPYLISDKKAQSLLLNQKKKLLKNPLKEFDSCNIVANYDTTREIYWEMCSKRYSYALASVVFGIYSLLTCKINLKNIMQDLFGIFIFAISTIFVSHSYYSFASEDLIWFCALLITNFSFPNFIFFIYYLKTPGRIFFENDRFNTRISKFENVFQAIFIICLFILLKMTTFKGNRWSFTFNHKLIANLFKIMPQISFMIYGYFTNVNFTDKITFGILYPSIDTLITIHFKSYLAINFIFFLKNIDINTQLSTKYILLSLIPYFLNFEKVIQTIDYDVFNAYSYDFGSLSNFTGVLCYIIFPPIYIHNLFRKESPSHILSIFSLLICLVCSWFLHGSLVYQYFFVSRLLFIILFFMVDWIIVEATKLLNKKSLKQFKKYIDLFNK